MDFLYSSLPMKAFWFGILSAISLPLGALIGILFKPTRKITAAFMSFGAGALLAALTLELVHPAFEHSGFYPLATGAIIGGVLFYAINRILNSKGGFFRKPSTLRRHIIRLNKKKMRELINFLSSTEAFRNISHEKIEMIAPYLQTRKIKKGTTVIEEGGDGDSIFFVKRGRFEVEKKGKFIAELGEGQIVGEMGALSGTKRTSTIKALTNMRIYELTGEDFIEHVRSCPEIYDAFFELANSRLNQNIDTQNINNEEIEQWKKEAQRRLDHDIKHITTDDITHIKKEHGHSNAAIAIWLGILLDGIPESAVIGASMVKSAVSLPLIIGLFLANFPEALSSAVGMREQGSTKKKILIMWGSLMILTGLGALFGNIFFMGASHTLFAIFEGCAAGAMLAMIAETMLPEAYEQGGTIVGMSTLLGFLAALFVKTL